MADVVTAKISQAGAQNRFAAQFVSDPLAAQTITGTFSAVVRGLESNANADAWLQIIIRTVSNDGSAVRGTNYAGSTATSVVTTAGAENQELIISAQTRIKNALALTSVSAQAGDRLVIEIGIRAITANTSSGTLRFGDLTASGDFALTSGLTTDLDPWVELSQTLTFAPGSAAGSGTWTFSGSATGQRAPKGTASGSWSFSGSATGKRTPKGTATGSWSYTGTASGARTPKATGSGIWTYTGAASGVRTPKATATGVWSYAGSATGTAPTVGQNSGSASGAWEFTGTATGRRDPKATATGTWSFTGSAAGTAPGEETAAGSAVGSWGFTGSATGKRAPKGAASGAWGFAGVAIGGEVTGSDLGAVVAGEPRVERRVVATGATARSGQVPGTPRVEPVSRGHVPVVVPTVRS